MVSLQQRVTANQVIHLSQKIGLMLEVSVKTLATLNLIPPKSTETQAFVVNLALLFTHPEMRKPQRSRLFKLIFKRAKMISI